MKLLIPIAIESPLLYTVRIRSVLSLVNTRGFLVYTGDYNGTVVFLYEYEGPPLVQEITSALIWGMTMV